ncbi:hypothetical protein CDD82_3036 [Ophiocordyceps australis]|uniref:FAD/NAD(P)-binding domain-containing protein n=1 Tax=Ophiocordyceps australis TaxID=1399860 RepID=A0A2C5ZF28_9HYPO|nr:hypothetical protein CDD82_3036 [Ophiocordyceps australis]
MWLQATALFILSALAGLVQPVPVAEDVATDYDAVIVGGGPSGLAALSALARVRRKALLIDSAEYRNQATRHMHDVLGFDGVTPAYYRWAARKQIAYYETVDMKNGTVVKIEPLRQPRSNNTYFRVTDRAANGTRCVVTARKVVLGTGLRDLLPGTPGLRENWGKGIYWCPWCDGHEHADQSLGLLSSLDEVPGLVREILTLNKDIVAFVNGSDTPAMRAATGSKEPQWEEYLRIHNVRIENATLQAIERLADGGAEHQDPSLPTAPEYDKFNVRLADGRVVERDAFFTSFKNEQASRIGQDSGVKLTSGGRLMVDPTKGLVTNIPGVYAIGDANSDNVTNVPHALFSGKRTGVFLHVQLERENAAQELGKVAKRSIHQEARDLWDHVNGDQGDVLYAGPFDQ